MKERKESVSFWLRGKPYAMPRPRAATKKDGRAYVYQPDTNAKRWRARVCGQSRYIAGNEQFKGAVRVLLEFCFLHPASHYNHAENGKKIWLKPGFDRKQHTSKPDLDNLAKPVLDGLVDSGVIKDDAQIIELNMRKKWATKEEGTWIFIERAGNE